MAENTTTTSNASTGTEEYQCSYHDKESLDKRHHGSKSLPWNISIDGMIFMLLFIYPYYKTFPGYYVFET